MPPPSPAVTDTTAPTIPTGLTAFSITTTGLTLSWVASTDAVGVTSYDILLNGSVIGSSTTTTFVVPNLSPATNYQLSVIAADAAGNKSLASSALTATTLANNGSPIALNVRVQGLALGEQVNLAHSQATLTATLNKPYSFTPQVAAGSTLDLRVTTQPKGQVCAVSESAPTTVPADGSPIFVRCFSTPSSRITMPDTLPNDPLSFTIGLRDIAYPGIAYESRPGVVGGNFPYEYRLKSFTFNGVTQATDNFKLDFRHGTVRFIPVAEGTYVVTLEVRDSGSTQKVLQQNFTIQCAASRFVFVAPDGIDSAGHGSLALPYQSLAYALSNSTSTQAILMRQGSYLTGSWTISDSKAKQILAYPDEVVKLDLNKAGSITVNAVTAPAARIEDVDLTHVFQWGIVSDPSTAGLVIRHVRFLDGEESLVPSENPAFIHARGDSAPTSRHQLLVQDNDFGPFVMKSSGAYALTLFDAGQSIVENNQIQLGATTGGIHDKDNSQFNTYRENYIAFDITNKTPSGIQISAQANSEHVHIHHNLLINAGIYLGVQCFQSSCYMRDHDVHHNTIANERIVMNWGPFNPTSYGTRINHNIISHGSLSPYWGLSCLSAMPAGFATQLVAGANLIESSSAFAFKDMECTGRDQTWTAWQNTYGMDTLGSESTVTTSSVLVGTGPLTGLPAGDARRTLRGHQFP